METLAIVATKGGVGKTTMAVHLAAAAQNDGRRVLLLDLDYSQGSAAQWGRDRQRLAKDHGAWFKVPMQTRTVQVNDLPHELQSAREEGFDLVILDTPPHTDFPAARAVELADIVLMPVRPGYFDLHAAKATIRIVKDFGTPAFGVINQVPHNTLRVADDAKAFLASKGMDCAPCIITLLQPYVRALRNGLTAPELVPDGRHAQEIGALWEFVRTQLAAAPRKAPPVTRVVEHSETSAMLMDDPFADILGSVKGDAA